LPLQGKAKSSGSIHVSLTPVNFGITASAAVGKAAESAVPRADASTVGTSKGNLDTPDGAPASSPVAAHHTGSIHNPQKAQEAAQNVIKSFAPPAHARDRTHSHQTQKSTGMEDLRRSIELAAYYKAEASGWTKSQEECWLEAEREVKDMLEGRK
jgi:hypothetical protein